MAFDWGVMSSHTLPGNDAVLYSVDGNPFGLPQLLLVLICRAVLEVLMMTHMLKKEYP